MAISPPRYALQEANRLGRRDRVWALFVTNLRLRIGSPLPVALIVVGLISTVLPLLFTVALNQAIGRGSTVELSAFYEPYTNFLLVLFILLLAALVGGGIVADDLGTKSISLYLSRPITLLDYLSAKGAVVVAALSFIAILPGFLGVVVAYVLGYVSAGVALEALGAYLGLGLLLTMTFAALALFLSSLTDRRAWASAGILAIFLIDDVVADALAGIYQNVSWLYASVWEDQLAVARDLFGVANTGPHPDPLTALLVLVIVIIALSAVTYFRLERMELVTE